MAYPYFAYLKELELFERVGTYIDCLPEEIIQNIWKFVYEPDSCWKLIYDDILKELPTTMCVYATFLNNLWDLNIPLCITREVIKKTKDNVVSFHRNYFENNEELRQCLEFNNVFSYSWHLPDREKYSVLNVWLTQSIYCCQETAIHHHTGAILYRSEMDYNTAKNLFRNRKIKKEVLFKMLEINGYVKSIQPRQTKKRQYYKSWTKDRIIKELMSL